MSEIVKSKIRKYIKLLKKRKEKYTFRQAYELICNQIKQEEALNEEDMEGIRDEIWTRLKENWPFIDVI
jgi:hypothetical protein